MPLIRYNFMEKTWSKHIDYINAIANNNRKVFKDSKGVVLIKEGGLYQIPTTNKEWATWVKYEHEARVLWFRPHIKKSLSGFLERAPIGPSTTKALACSIIWNAALYIHCMKKPIAPEAIRRALLQGMQETNCPPELFNDSVDALEQMCLSVLEAISDNCGNINRCAIGILEDELQDSLRRRTCTNRFLRRTVCMRLITNGIATLKSRTLQRKMMLDELKNVHELKAGAFKAIERMLLRDDRILRFTEGVSILLPYTREEDSKRKSNARKRITMDHVMERNYKIACKITEGKKLTAAERKYKSLHKDEIEKLLK